MKIDFTKNIPIPKDSIERMKRGWMCGSSGKRAYLASVKP
jgi:hypothetical protein